MAKPKNQTVLVNRFMKGETSGTLGHLQIFGDTLYNTENEEYLPVCRRVGPPGNDKIFCINESNYAAHHIMYKLNKSRVIDALDELKSNNSGMPNSGYPQIEYVVMKISAEPTSAHKLDKSTTEDIIRTREKVVKIHDYRISDIEAGTYKRSAYEIERTDEELIKASQRIINESSKFAKYLKADLKDEAKNTQIRDIELLVNAPEVMNQAIADGGIDPDKLRRLLETRDRVKSIIKNVEDYIAVILAIPSEPPEAHSHIQGRTVTEIIVDDQVNDQ